MSSETLQPMPEMAVNANEQQQNLELLETKDSENVASK